MSGRHPLRASSELEPMSLPGEIGRGGEGWGGAVLCNIAVRCGVAWCCAVRCGVVLCCAVRCGAARRGHVRQSYLGLAGKYDFPCLDTTLPRAGWQGWLVGIVACTCELAQIEDDWA